MGLDMYLYAQTRGESLDLAADDVDDALYEQIHWRSPAWESEDWFRKVYMTPERIEQDAAKPYQITKIAYWRKANQIHGWFVDNVQDGIDECQYTEVSLEQLAGLRTTCERVLSDPALAETELPPRQGFFFGAYDYNEYYFSDLKETVEQIDAIETAERARHDQHLPPRRYWYHASW